MRYTIKDMRAQFPDDDACLQQVFDSRYGELKACPKCGVVNAKYYRLKKRISYSCKECRHQIYPLAGTIFEKSTTPLTDWFHAMYLFSVSKNGVSAKEIERQVGVSYKTAHRMAKMIRVAMVEGGKLGFLDSPVEVDEAYIGGRRKQTEIKDNKTPLLAALEVGGHVRTRVVDKAHAKTVVPFIEDVVYKGANLHTDESFIYRDKRVKQNYNHASVRHVWHEFSKNGVTTNHVESFFGQFKNSIRGTYHAVSPRYLNYYASEFAFRYNHRNEAIFSLLLAKAGKQL